MKIDNSDINDLEKILELYQEATKLMESKNQVSWPKFSTALITNAINELRQWKLTVKNEIVCIWTTTTNDELIWGTENNTPSIYIHRISTSPNFRGRNLVKHIVNWADTYCTTNNLKFIRMDTVGLNRGLITHYEKLGFNFIGTKNLKNTIGLPAHYNEAPVCLFEREVLTHISSKKINEIKNNYQ